MDQVRAAARSQGIEINPDAFRGAHLLWVTRDGADQRALRSSRRSSLPITAISSVYGMNLIVSDSTRPMHLFLVVVGMAVVSGLILRLTRRSGWW